MTQVAFGDLFDALVDALGAELAVDVLNRTTAYRDQHDACDLPGGVLITDDGINDVRIEFAHDPDCPALQTEGADHDHRAR